MNIQRDPESGIENTDGSSNSVSAYPIPASDRNTMFSDRNSAMKKSDGSELTFIDSIVSVKSIIDYYNQNINQGFLGLRFYPGYKDNESVFSILCLSNEIYATDSSEVLLINTNMADPLVPTTISIARTYISDYWTKVYIDGQQQSETNKYYKKSRYFSWETIIIYLKANIQGFTENDPSTYQDYSLNFEHGFCTETQANIFIGYGIKSFPGMDAIDLCGYAIIMQVLDAHNNPIIDQAAIYEADNYVGRHLEVSKPCPPYCGDTF